MQLQEVLITAWMTFVLVLGAHSITKPLPMPMLYKKSEIEPDSNDDDSLPKRPFPMPLKEHWNRPDLSRAATALSY